MHNELAFFGLNLYKCIVKVDSSVIRDQIIFKFPNGYGASLIRGKYTYGGPEGLYEIAVVKWDNEGYYIDYSTVITDDVMGYVEPNNVIEILNSIYNLPQYAPTMTDNYLTSID